MEDDSSLSSSVPPVSAANAHLRMPLKATRIVNEGDPNLDETCRSTIANEPDVCNRNLEEVVEKEEDTENQKMPPSQDQEKSMMTTESETTTIVPVLPSEVQLSNTEEPSTEEAEGTLLTDDMSGDLSKEEGSLLNTFRDYYEDSTADDELGTASDCESSIRSRISNSRMSSGSINLTDENSSLSGVENSSSEVTTLSSRKAATATNETFTPVLDGDDQKIVDNAPTLFSILNSYTLEDSLSEQSPRTETTVTGKDIGEEMEKNGILAEQPISNKSVLDSSIASKCSQQLSDSLTDFITLENQIDNELNISRRLLLQEENEALKLRIRILEDDNSALTADLMKETKALDIAEKERSDYKFLFEEQAGQLKESKKGFTQQLMEYEKKLEEAHLAGNAVEELRHELENERLRNNAIEEERNRLILEVEELRRALGCREKEILEIEEDWKSLTEKLSLLTTESSAAAEKMELNVRELKDLQEALKEKEATAKDLYQQFQLKEQQSSVFEDMTKAQSVEIKQLENENELQSTQISKLESDLLEAESRCEDAVNRLNSLEEEHEELLSQKAKSLEDAFSKLTLAEEENNKLKASLAERNSVFDGMKAEFFESVNKNAEAIAHLRYEGDLTKKLLSEKTAEAETLKAQLSSLLQTTAELEAEKFRDKELLLDKAAMIEALEKDKECRDALMSEKMSTIEELATELATERKEKGKDKVEMELQEARRSADVIAPIAPLNAAEVTDLQLKMEELTWRLAQKTAEAERAWKACDEMEVSEADYKKRIGHLLEQIDEYKIKCGEESSTGLLDVLQPSFPGGPSPPNKNDATNCQHQ